MVHVPFVLGSRAIAFGGPGVADRMLCMVLNNFRDLSTYIRGT